MFQFFKTPFSTKITNFTIFSVLKPKFTQNLRSKASNLAKIQFYKPYFSKVQFFKPYFFKKSVLWAPIFGAYRFLKPPFAALRAAHLYQNESWVLGTNKHNSCSLQGIFHSQPKHNINKMIRHSLIYWNEIIFSTIQLSISRGGVALSLLPMKSKLSVKILTYLSFPLWKSYRPYHRFFVEMWCT